MIPASLFVILIPLLCAAPAYAARRARTFEAVIAVVGCAVVMALLAAPGQRVILPGFAIDINAPVSLLGREMRVWPYARYVLILLFGCAAVLFAFTWRVRQGWTYIPMGLIVLTLLAFALMIRPFIFSALAIVAASAMLAIMIQTETDEDNLTGLEYPSVLGAMRYLSIAVLSMPFLLTASYLMSHLGNVTTDPQATERASAFIAVGFVILLGGFPLFTWIHPVSRDAPPLTTAFISSIAIGALGFSAFALRQEYDWFNASAAAQDIFRASGAITLLFSALTGWAQKSFSRSLSGMVGIGAGLTLLMLAGAQPLDVQSMAMGVAARALSIGLMGFGLALLREGAPGDDFASLRGLGAKYPLALLALTLGGLSAVGLPGTLGFVSRWVGARAMANRGDLETMFLLVAAIASVGVGFVRGVRALMGDPQPAPGREDVILEATPPASGRLARYRLAMNNDLRSAILVGAGAVAILALGIFPAGLGALAQLIAASFSFYR